MNVVFDAADRNNVNVDIAPDFPSEPPHLLGISNEIDAILRSIDAVHEVLCIGSRHRMTPQTASASVTTPYLGQNAKYVTILTDVLLGNERRSAAQVFAYLRRALSLP